MQIFFFFPHNVDFFSFFSTQCRMPPWQHLGQKDGWHTEIQISVQNKNKKKRQTTKDETFHLMSYSPTFQHLNNHSTIAILLFHYEIIKTASEMQAATRILGKVAKKAFLEALSTKGGSDQKLFYNPCFCWSKRAKMT